MFPQAECYRVYRDLRRGVPGCCEQLGKGFNLYPPSADLCESLRWALARLGDEGRLGQYSCESDELERELFARLAGRRLGMPELRGEHVFFTHGGHEAISIGVQALARQSAGILLPLPGYYAYEQSVLRCGLEVRARYAEDGRLAGRPEPGDALASVWPNGVSGQVPAVPDPVTERPSLIDLVYQIAAPEQVAAGEELLRIWLAGFDLERSLLVLTPAKDLSLPSLRAGVLLTRSEGMADFLRRDRAERSYAVGPLPTWVCLRYLSLILAYRAHVLENDAHGEWRWLIEQYRDLGVSGAPTQPEIEQGVEHWLRMTARFRDCMGVLRRHQRLFKLETLSEPQMGYSCFPALRRSFSSPREFVAWVNEVGRKVCLKLNPTVLFGGTADSWQTLYPGQARIRVNLSCAPDELESQLCLLTKALDEIPPQSHPPKGRAHAI